MDIIDKIKQFINDSIQSLFAKQKEDLSLIIHKEAVSIVSDLQTFISQQVQANSRDMANMQQNVFSLNQKLQNLLDKLDIIQDFIDELKEHQTGNTLITSQMSLTSPEPQITTYYAKMVDSTYPLGFKIDNLKNNEDGCAFMITLKGESEGSYRIVDDAEIQQEILAAFNPIISDSSTYDYLPQNPTQITVINEGMVVKEDGLLRITKKQKIEIN